MTEIANRGQTEAAQLDSLAAEARLYRASIDMSMYQLARVFVQAKELVPHGEWGQWLRDNADVSVRTAQDMMAVYRRFGDRPAFENIGKSKLFRMLSLPEGSEEDFASEHDLDAMTIKEIDEAVRRERAKAQIEIDREKAARRDAEARADRAERREAEPPQELLDQLRQDRADLKEAQDNAQHFARMAKQAISDKAALERENKRLQADLNDQTDMLKQQQEALDQAQEALLSMQSAEARSEGERDTRDELTLQTLSAAVREFIGSCARMPYLGPQFAQMPQRDRSAYRELVQTVEGWCEGARRALDTVVIEAVNGRA